MRVRVILPAVAALAAFPTLAMAAQGPECAPFDAVVAKLAQSYSERPVARAINSEGQLLLVMFASPDGATWTEVGVRASDHVACIIGAGTDWEMVAPKAQQTTGIITD